MIRIINRIVKDGHLFTNPSEYQPRAPPPAIADPPHDERARRTEERLFPYEEEAKAPQRERSRDREEIATPVSDMESVGTWRNAKPCYVRIKGFPWGTEKAQIENFFYNIKIAKEVGGDEG